MNTILGTAYSSSNASVIAAAEGKYEEVIEIVRSCNAELITFESIKLEVKIKRITFHKLFEVLKRCEITVHDVKYIGIDKMKFTLKGFQNSCSVQVNDDVEGAKETLNDFIKMYLHSSVQNKIKIISFEPTYFLDSPVIKQTSNQDDTNGNKGKVHSEEWNAKIGDGHRGLKYKTKALEGITWKRQGNKKVWLYAA